MTTKGDQIPRALSKVGGRRVCSSREPKWFPGSGHSLKDVPMELPEGFVLAAMTREDPRDAFVSN